MTDRFQSLTFFILGAVTASVVLLAIQPYSKPIPQAVAMPAPKDQETPVPQVVQRPAPEAEGKPATNADVTTVAKVDETPDRIAAEMPVDKVVERSIPQAEKLRTDDVLSQKGLRRQGPVLVLKAEDDLKPMFVELSLTHAEWERIVAQMVELENLVTPKKQALIDLDLLQRQIQTTLAAPLPIVDAKLLEARERDRKAEEKARLHGENEPERVIRERNKAQTEQAVQAHLQNRQSQLLQEQQQNHSRVDEIQRAIAQCEREYGDLSNQKIQKEGHFQRRRAELQLTVDALMRQYSDLANDREVKAALAELNKDRIQFALGPEKDYKANLAKMNQEFLQGENVGIVRNGPRQKPELVPVENTDVEKLAFNTRKIADQLKEAQKKFLKLQKDQKRSAASRSNFLKQAAQKVSQANAQLARPLAPPQKAQVVDDLNFNKNRIANLQKEEVAAAKKRGELASEVATGREAFVRSVFDLQKAVEQAGQKRDQLAKVPQLKGMPIKTVSPSALKYLKEMEDRLKTEEVPLEPDKGIFWVEATLNGKTRRMVIDPSVEVVRISAILAGELGIMPTDADPTVEVAMDGGQKLKAKRKTLDSIRVGSFTVDDVECLVILDEYKAPPMLGASFLNNFVIKVDHDAGKLNLTRVEMPVPQAAVGGMIK